MTFTSKLDWETDINTVGGQSNILLVDSPYSDLPSANASQGALTYGNLVNEFKPPKIEISPIDNGYYIHSRMHTGDKNAAVDVVDGGVDKEPAKDAAAPGKEGFRECMRQKVYKGPSRRGYKETTNRPERGNITEEKKEGYTEMPEFVGSNIHQEAFSFETFGKWTFSFMIIFIALLITWFVLYMINRAKPDLLPQWLKNIVPKLH